MKNVKQAIQFLLLGLVLLLATAANAQRPGRTATEGRPQMSAEERAQKMADQQKENLGLSEEQHQKVYAIHLAHAQKHEAKRGERQRDMEQRRADIEAIEASRDSELRKVLTDEQYAKYQQNRQDAASKIKERRENAPQQRKRSSGRG